MTNEKGWQMKKANVSLSALESFDLPSSTWQQTGVPGTHQKKWEWVSADRSVKSSQTLLTQREK